MPWKWASITQSWTNEHRSFWYSNTSEEPKCPQTLLPHREFKWMTTQMTTCFATGGRSVAQGESPMVPTLTHTHSPTYTTDTNNVSLRSCYRTSSGLSFFLLELESTWNNFFKKHLRLKQNIFDKTVDIKKVSILHF